MRIRLSDPSIPIVDFQLGVSIAAYLATAIDGILLGVEMAARSATAAAAHVPSTIRIRNDVMRSTRVLTLGHLFSPVCSKTNTRLATLLSKVQRKSHSAHRSAIHVQRF
ncbi:UNVERIFIED_ORG: hypothetical protein GGD48_004823 [Rhizobium etli]